MERWHSGTLGSLGPRPGQRKEEFERLLATETDQCLEWTGYTRRGYGYIGDNGKVKFTHRLALERKIGSCPDGMEAAHTCGNSRCMNYRHLRWDTPKGNAADKRRHGTHAPPRRRYHQITEDDRETILTSSDSNSALARLIGCSRATIVRIKSQSF